MDHHHLYTWLPALRKNNEMVFLPWNLKWNLHPAEPRTDVKADQPTCQRSLSSSRGGAVSELVRGERRPPPELGGSPAAPDVV